MLKLRIADSDQDHFVVYADEPLRVEVSLLPTPEGLRVIMHAYTGLNLDLNQEPTLTYDGSEHADMQDMDRGTLAETHPCSVKGCDTGDTVTHQTHPA